MRYFKQSLITFLIFLFCMVVFYGFSEGMYLLFILPIFADGIFLTFYLSKEYEKNDQAKLQENSSSPDTLAYIQTRRMMIIIYCALFFIIASFFWGYLSSGLVGAIKNLLYMGLLFWCFVVYVLLVPSLYDYVQKLFPVKIRAALSGDWQRGYTFLLPITFLIYLLYPIDTLRAELTTKLLHFPLFFVIYTFSFLCLYCIVYFYQDLSNEKKSVQPVV